MTVEAVLAAELTGRGAPQFGAIVQPTGMATDHMAALAKQRRSLNQHVPVVRTVRIMAERAVFADRRMVEQHRTALVRMAAMTYFID